jgi:hypothetical protein
MYRYPVLSSGCFWCPGQGVLLCVGRQFVRPLRQFSLRKRIIHRQYPKIYTRSPFFFFFSYLPSVCFTPGTLSLLPAPKVVVSVASMGLFGGAGDLVSLSADLGSDANALLFDAASAKGDVLEGAFANAPNAEVMDLAVDGGDMYDENDPVVVVPAAADDDEPKTDPETRLGD